MGIRLIKKFDRLEFEKGLIPALGIDGGVASSEEIKKFLRSWVAQDRAEKITQSIFEDLRFFRSLDPASTDYTEEQILSVRRGMSAIAAHRIFREILEADEGLLYEIEVLAKYVQKDTNVEIHPSAAIDVPFAIDHGHGTVIGATSVLGQRVFIYHGVTLGASGKRSKSQRRHPIVGDDVFFGNGSQVLGPAVIEDGVRLAANVTIRDCLIGKGSSIAMGATLSGVVIPSGSKVFNADAENHKRYWMSLPGQSQPSWVIVEAFRPEDLP